MKHLKFKKLNEKGQSAVEFIIVTVVVFFFLLFYMSFAITLVASEYVDYATFMAARAYKSGNINQLKQETAGKIVFDQYLEPINSVIKSRRINFTNGGAISSYQVDLFYLPPLFVKTPTPSRITLNSEAIMGRDPSIDDCLNFFSSLANQFGFGQTYLTNVMEDNGC